MIRLLLVGGTLNNELQAGVAYRNSNNDLGNANWNISSQLCYHINKDHITIPLGKT